MGLIELSLWDKLKRIKADKVVGAVEGNFAKLDANGNLVDSGHKDADYEDADATILKEADVVDSLDSTSTKAPLSANQGKVLKDAVDPIIEDVSDHETRLDTQETESVAFENLFNSLTNPLSIKPVLNLDFANRKVLDPRITFARASTGRYYDGKTFAKAEENLTLYSEQFAQSPWVRIATNITSNVANAPNGEATADEWITVAGEGIHYITQAQASRAGYIYTHSIYLKAGTHHLVQMSVGNDLASRYVNFDLNAGVFNAYTLSASMVDIFGDGSWYRCSITFTASATNASIQFCLINSLADARQQSWTALGTESVYIWGAQVEQRDSLTAYTPTTDQPITNYIPVLKEASVDEARFDHDPVTGESLGLLIEEQRTNLISRSIPSIMAGGWQVSGLSKPLGTSIAPDGTNNAIWMGYTGAGAHQWFRTISLASGTIRTISAFFKKTDARYFYIENDPTTAFAWFDLDNGTVAYANAECTAEIKYYGNGWYRCWITTSEPAAYVQVGFNSTISTSSGHSHPSTGIQSGIAWGVQVEEGSFLTSYIPTAGSQVTRSADNASMTGENFSSWYREKEGTILTESSFFDFDSTSASDTNRVLWINNANKLMYDTIIHISFQKDGYVRCGQRMNNISLGSITPVDKVVGANIFGRVAFAYKDFSWSAVVDAGTIASKTDIITASGMDNMLIGKGRDDIFLNGHIKKIAYYNQRISDSDLHTLTT